MLSTLEVIGLLIVVGVALWGINKFEFIDKNAKVVIYVVIVIATTIAILRNYHMLPWIK